MKTRLFLSLVAVLGLFAPLAGAAEAPPQPGWINGAPPEKYSGAGYLTAVGSGSTRSDAEADAKRGLSQTFGVQVQSALTRLAESRQSDDSDGKSKSEDSSQTSSDLKLKSDVKLRGVSIAEYYQEPSSGTWHALAVLNKNKASVSYLTELNQRARKIDALVQKFKSRPKPAMVGAIERELEQFDRLMVEASVLGPVAVKRPITETEMDALDAKADELASQSPVTLEFMADPNASQGDRFLDRFKDCLDDNKVRVHEKSDDMASAPAKRLKVKFSQRTLPLAIEGWVRVRYSASAELLDGKKVALSKDVEVIEKARNEEGAFELATPKLLAGLCDRVVKGLGN